MVNFLFKSPYNQKHIKLTQYVYSHILTQFINIRIFSRSAAYDSISAIFSNRIPNNSIQRSPTKKRRKNRETVVQPRIDAVGYCSITDRFLLDLRNDRSLSGGISFDSSPIWHLNGRWITRGFFFESSRKWSTTVSRHVSLFKVRHAILSLSLFTCVSPRSWDRELRISAREPPSDSPSEAKRRTRETANEPGNVEWTRDA